MKRLTLLWQTIADELGDLCSTSTINDFKTVVDRVEHEGLSFLTITLPQFCKDFERSLDNELVTRDLFQGFTWRGGLPLFLGGFLELVFDRGTGLLIDDPSVDAIYAVRQLTLLYSKVELPTTPEREKSAMEGFINCEQEIKKTFDILEPERLEEFQRIGRLIWCNVLSGADYACYWDLLRDHTHEGWPYIRPKHGPGATGDRLTGNSKFDVDEWPERLERTFPYLEYALPNRRHHVRLGRVNFLEPGAERPVRVVSVPKTMKTPRIIAIEPTAMQYIQQGLKNVLVPLIQRDPNMGRIVGFDDQHINRVLARHGSLYRDLATLDLSEASDRVSNQLVEKLLQDFPSFSEGVQACRSTRADVLGEVYDLSKFASMGSALTFPVEAMVFATVVFHGIEQELKRPLTLKDIKSFKEVVRVYGDDIIVPVGYVHSVMESLKTFGFKVNTNKSFWTGKFRESCGREYFDGHDVSVVKVRKLVIETNFPDFPSSLRRHADVIESFVALANNFYVAGLWRTAQWLDRSISKVLKGHYPVVELIDGGPEVGYYSRSPLLGRWSFLGYQSERTHPTLHTPVVQGYVTRANSPTSYVSDIGSLQKVLSAGSSRERPDVFGFLDGETFQDPEHLLRAGRPRTVYTKFVKNGRPY